MALNQKEARMMERYNMLVNSDRVHASPTEHQAAPDTQFKDIWGGLEEGWQNPHLHGNLHGWQQARKLIPNERYRG